MPGVRVLSLMTVVAATALASIVFSYIIYRRVEGFGPES